MRNKQIKNRTISHQKPVTSDQEIQALYMSSEEQINLTTVSRKDAADYIQQLTVELASLARNAQLDLLAYFLDMARIEAETQVRKTAKE